MNPFNSTSQSQRKLTRLGEEPVVYEEPTDDEIEECIEIEQESVEDHKSGSVVH